jgi:hypothetical protein
MSDANETVALVEADVANESHEDVSGEFQDGVSSGNNDEDVASEIHDDLSSENVDDVVACERSLLSDV